MLEVVEPGLLTTIQDAGRPDAVGLGVPCGGACDPWSLRVANALAGNEPWAPAIEVTVVGPTLRVLADCHIGLAGADLDVRIQPGDQRLEPGTSRVLRQGETVVFGAATPGAGVRAYLALSGGVDVPLVLGSASTCLVGRFGGMAGRPLMAGDVIRAGDGPSHGDSSLRRWHGETSPALAAPSRPLRVLPGPHADRLAGGAFEQLLATEWTVSAHGDRQGIRLDGAPLPVDDRAAEMLSQGVCWGAIQLPPDGQPICLLADRQTIGGYPVAAVVISADLPLLGQLGPTDGIRFVRVSMAETHDALLVQERAWAAGVAGLSAPG
jgi:biotin-dependent carboxylase-like uncharacterized protein